MERLLLCVRMDCGMIPWNHEGGLSVKKKRKWIKWVILAAIVLLVAMWLILVNRTSESVA